MSNPLLYIFLGTPNAGRRTVVYDLVSRGMIDGQKAAIAVYKDETPSDILKTLALNPQVRLMEWVLNDEGMIQVSEEYEDVDAFFFITQGNASPIDQMEVLVKWIKDKELELGRVFTVVDCELASAQSKLMLWFEACIHFSDVVLLNKREAVSQNWIKKFIEKFQKEECYPCLFENVKKGRLDNPQILLHPEARRISQVFDERDAIDELDIDIDNLPEEPFDLKIKEDPYFERLPSGGRAKPVPDVRAFLS